jgi:metal-responsive CopG/Arc/MetJ family transcriptional regulator
MTRLRGHRHSWLPRSKTVLYSRLRMGDKLTGMQHLYSQQILSTPHFHLDHDNCLEVLVIKGKAGNL